VRGENQDPATARTSRSSDIICGVFLPNPSVGVRKSLSADMSKNEGSAVSFEMTARRESRLRVASSSSELRMIRSSGSALRCEGQNLAWTDHLAGRQSLTNKNMDSPEAQPYSR
jgi:hypothetical protein